MTLTTGITKHGRTCKNKAAGRAARCVVSALAVLLVFSFCGCKDESAPEGEDTNSAASSSGNDGYFISESDGASVAKTLVSAYEKSMAPFDKWGNSIPADVTDPTYQQEVKEFRELFVDPKAFLLCAGEYLQDEGMDLRILAADLPYIKEYMKNIKKGFNSNVLGNKLVSYAGDLDGLYRFSKEYPKVFQAMLACQPDCLVLGDCTYEDLDAFLNGNVDFEPFLSELGNFVEDEYKEEFEWQDHFTWTESMLKNYFGGNGYGAKNAETNTILLAKVDDKACVSSLEKWIQSVLGDVSFTQDPDCAGVILYSSLFYEDYSYSNTNGSGGTKNVKVGTYVFRALDAVTGESLGEYRVSGSAPSTISGTDASDAYYVPADLDTDEDFVAFLNGLTAHE